MMEKWEAQCCMLVIVSLLEIWTPRGGTGKLRNHWEESIHVVIRQVGEEIPVYEVKPEQGRGRSRILHRNLLLPCDHLPLELQPKTASKQKKRMPETAEENANQEEEDDECGYYYQPVVQPQVPSLDRATEHADAQEDEDRETPGLNSDEPVVEERSTTNTNESETQQENELLEDEDQSENELPVGEAQDEIQDPPCSDSGEDDREQGHYLERRERRAPKFFTYDQLGTPACYSAARANDALYQYQPLLYREVQPVTLWQNPLHCYQPLFMKWY